MQSRQCKAGRSATRHGVLAPPRTTGTPPPPPPPPPPGFAGTPGRREAGTPLKLVGNLRPSWRSGASALGCCEYAGAQEGHVRAESRPVGTGQPPTTPRESASTSRQPPTGRRRIARRAASARLARRSATGLTWPVARTSRRSSKRRSTGATVQRDTCGKAPVSETETSGRVPGPSRRTTPLARTPGWGTRPGGFWGREEPSIPSPACTGCGRPCGGAPTSAPSPSGMWPIWS